MESKILELIQNLTNINSPSGNAYSNKLCKKK